ncbi:hypothetical protein GGQ18_000033 [Salinibacter ruber]|nr:transposase [Salinibacter ruber]MBB4067474.1 hypothetical protein [Salinibacter ruber]
MIGIAEGGIAYPVVWSVLGHGGGSGASEHTDLLKQFLRLVEPDELRALVADREPAGSDFLKELDQREIPFVIRLKKDRRIGPPPTETSSTETSSTDASSEEWSLLVKMFARACTSGQTRQLPAPKGLGGAESVECQVTARRLEEDSFLILAGQKVDPGSMLDLYRKRWEIETLFAALGVQRLRAGGNPHDWAQSDSEAARNVSADLQLDSDYRHRPRGQRRPPLGNVPTGIRRRAYFDMDWIVSGSLRPTGIGQETNCTGASRRLSLHAHFWSKEPENSRL